MVPCRRLCVIVGLVLLATLGTACAQAQHECKFGGEEAAEKLDDALEHAKTCKEAADLFNECSWGSSADSGFGGTAVARCEKEFYKKLTPAQQYNYADNMQLCGYEYARQRGTMYISAAASCQVHLAASIAADAHVADTPVPRASFDCARAQTPLEKAICSDASLGRADVMLGRIYREDLKRLKGQERVTFIDNEKKWLRDVAGQCALTSDIPSRKVLNCLRNAFEMRFSSLDNCGDEGPSGCLSPDTDPEDYRGTEDDPAAPRASFDCDAPKTALQVVICDDHQLGQEDIEVAHAFDAAASGADAATRHVLEDSQRKWLEFVHGNCPLGVVGGIPDIFTRGCIRSAYEVRRDQLGSCMKQRANDREQCLGDFKIMEK
jgi:uncharacterized protein